MMNESNGSSVMIRILSGSGGCHGKSLLENKETYAWCCCGSWSRLRCLQCPEMARVVLTKSNQIKSNRIKPNEIKSNLMKSMSLFPFAFPFCLVLS
jgi:hypothetical protein